MQHISDLTMKMSPGSDLILPTEII